MADRPKSITTTDTDVSLDFLTKEAKEALLSKKLDMIRERNKALTERHQLIEADRKKAEESGQAVKLTVDSQLFPAEGAVKSKGRGRGQTNHKEGGREGKERPKSSGDFRDSSNYEPIVDTSDLANYKHDHKGRGRGQHHFDGQSPAPKNKRKPPAKEEDSSRQFEYEPIVDIRDLDKRFGLVSESSRPTHPKYGYMRSDRDTRTEGGTRQRGEGKPYRGGPRPNKSDRRPYNREESGNDGETSFKQTDNDGSKEDPTENTYKGRLKDTDGPPPDPSFNPLADRRRSDKKEEPAEHRRHPRNYGGTADLNRVKQTMKNMREKEKERPSTNKPLEIVMTGKERRNHEEWKAEREKYDQERIMRSMNSGGNWKRAWDVDKINQESEDSAAYRQEPGKRPAGRIGSGRFDRGERDERPRSAIIGKGGIQLSDHVPATQTPRPQHHQDPVPGGEGKTPRSWGRGRGRGRGHANGPGEKSPRPRTWSGGDDRFVECQKELLLVKFDNTAGDNSVEVEYDDDDLQSTPPPPPPATAKSAPHTPTTPGRGPTGRTPNQSQSSKPHQQPRSGKPYKGKAAPKEKETTQSNSHHHDPVISGIVQVKDEPEVPLPNSSDEASRVRTSSHSQSFADSEEWEDCTESSGAQEDTDLAAESSDLHLECRLNPEAPEFLPTSPDFMKTPPGHVKVLNWASDAGSTSAGPTSPLSQPSPSLRPLANSSSPAATSPCKNDQEEEEEDVMPETDEPFVLAPDIEKVLSDSEKVLSDSEKVLSDSEKVLSKVENVLPESEKDLPEIEKVLPQSEKVIPNINIQCEEDQFEDSIESAPDSKEMEVEEKCKPACQNNEILDKNLQEKSCEPETNQLTSTGEEQLLQSDDSKPSEELVENQPDVDLEAPVLTDSDKTCPDPGPGESLGSEGQVESNDGPVTESACPSTGPATEETVSGSSESNNSTPEISATTVSGSSEGNNSTPELSATTVSGSSESNNSTPEISATPIAETESTTS